LFICLFVSFLRCSSCLPSSLFILPFASICFKFSYFLYFLLLYLLTFYPLISSFLYLSSSFFTFLSLYFLSLSFLFFLHFLCFFLSSGISFHHLSFCSSLCICLDVLPLSFTYQSRARSTDVYRQETCLNYQRLRPDLTSCVPKVSSAARFPQRSEFANHGHHGSQSQVWRIAVNIITAFCSYRNVTPIS
jgi:hypothetical protein